MHDASGSVGSAWLRLVVLVGIAVGAMTVAGAPSPALFGGLLGSLVFALTARRRVVLPRACFVFGQLVVGVSIGALVDLPTLRGLGAHWSIILAVTLATLVLSVVVGQALRLHPGVTPVTGAFAMVAGGASGMAALARDLGADERVVTVVQYFRVLLILLAMPVVVSVVFGADGGSVTLPATPDAGTVTDVGFVVLALPLGWALGRLLRLPSPAILGGVLGGLALALLPAFEDAHLPAAVGIGGYLLVGAQVGLGFTLASLRAIGRMLPTAFVLIAVVIAGSAALGLLLADVTGESRLDGYLATTPGGLYAVLATAVDTGSNVTFVTGVQLVRLLVVLFAAPLLARLLTRTGRTGA